MGTLVEVTRDRLHRNITVETVAAGAADTTPGNLGVWVGANIESRGLEVDAALHKCLAELRRIGTPDPSADVLQAGVDLTVNSGRDNVASVFEVAESYSEDSVDIVVTVGFLTASGQSISTAVSRALAKWRDAVGKAV